MQDTHKILVVVGSRTQFIKAAAVLRGLKAYPSVREVTVHTGTPLSDNFFSRLGIARPAINLGVDVFSPGQPIDPLLDALEKTIRDESPDTVFICSDSNATLAAALAAARTNTRLARAEAGVRSFARHAAKERIRIICDHTGDMLFAANEHSAANLREEGIDEARIHVTGDIMYDAAVFHAGNAPETVAALEQAGLAGSQFVLAAIHRPENTDDPQKLSEIIRGLASASLICPVLMPLHPRTRAAMERDGLFKIPLHKLHITDPVSYLEVICLEKKARIIVTDSSGMQKEAYFHGRPCITVREKTEWPELVKAGWNRLVAAESDAIRHAVGNAMAAPSPYGERTILGHGTAGETIARLLAR